MDFFLLVETNVLFEQGYSAGSATNVRCKIRYNNITQTWPWGFQSLRPAPMHQGWTGRCMTKQM